MKELMESMKANETRMRLMQGQRQQVYRLRSRLRKILRRGSSISEINGLKSGKAFRAEAFFLWWEPGCAWPQPGSSEMRCRQEYTAITQGMIRERSLLPSASRASYTCERKRKGFDINPVTTSERK